jgi:sugar diacid utilization regulator
LQTPPPVRIAPSEVQELLAEDARLGGILLRTLHADVDADLKVGPTAVALAVHANTVHYRLRRISEIMGRNTRSFFDLVDLFCAVRVLRLAISNSN